MSNPGSHTIYHNGTFSTSWENDGTQFLGDVLGALLPGCVKMPNYPKLELLTKKATDKIIDAGVNYVTTDNETNP